ncbi:unnamed protein product [Didymodactylos carnosus]|uniref:F-box domain-containing protein n=1 Tax=Didymodactylos carnosus TaxID=1234261 RepID=A0A815M6R3_9BILA|nr:unnamed protein product [Didymodactylos carnosus]CAF4302062.1 unnamed protein product [Didymodactylos carnosus]
MPTCFENLNNELFYETFDYMDSYEIFYSLANLNQRIDNLICTMPRMHADITPDSFLFYYEKILPSIKSHLISLTLDNINGVKLAIFSTTHVLQTFAHLKALTLIGTTTTIVTNTLPVLRYLKINSCDVKDFDYSHIQHVFKLCPNLKWFSFSSYKVKFVNATTWKYVLSSTKITKFHLDVQFVNMYVALRDKIDIDKIRQEFENSFWRDKKWNIVCMDYIDNVWGAKRSRFEQHVKVYSVDN